MRADGARLMTRREQGGKNRAREVKILAAAFRGNEGSGYEAQGAPRSRLLRRFVTERRAPIMETGDGRNIKKAGRRRYAGTDFY